MPKAKKSTHGKSKGLHKLNGSSLLIWDKILAEAQAEAKENSYKTGGEIVFGKNVDKDLL